jgi:peroxiredoxin
MKLLFIALFLFHTSGLCAQIDNEYLEVGSTAPLIVGKDQNGQAVNSKEILKEHQLLLIFYRGNWCPYCNRHLSSLQKHLEQFREKGVFVLVVSPEKVEKTIETGMKYGNGFSIVHDVDNKIMRDYKVAFEVNEQTVPAYYKKLEKRLSEYNEANNNVLPVPATYLIDRSGKITYVHYDPDYRNRSDLELILKSLK